MRAWGTSRSGGMGEPRGAPSTWREGYVRCGCLVELAARKMGATGVGETVPRLGTGTAREGHGCDLLPGTMEYRRRVVPGIMKYVRARS